ncbi:MAG: hypothetical protein A2103_00815 [Gammaproteobacteria bacterium GWF2_41_13]|nr:MAG: hypothetical protein A2103_00815 [Gammaproteobacteria bacterium GWF2_41_13]
MKEKETKASKLDKVIDGLIEDGVSKKNFSKPISVRLPLLAIAQIDVLAAMKDVSRNVLVNEIVEAALEQLLDRMRKTNPKMAHSLEEKAAKIAKDMSED